MTKRVSVPFVIVLVLADSVGLQCAVRRSAIAAGCGPVDRCVFPHPGVPSGPSAPTANDNHYPQVGSLDSRLLMVHHSAAYVFWRVCACALIFCVLLNCWEWPRRIPPWPLRYDGLAQDLLKVALLALCHRRRRQLMLTMFITLYPSFMQYMEVPSRG